MRSLAAAPPAPVLLAALLLATVVATFPAPGCATLIPWLIFPQPQPQPLPPQPQLPQCPPPGFSSVSNLNLTAYTAAPWYAQLQMPISFQGEDPMQYLYCVKATYLPLPPDDPRVQAANRAAAKGQSAAYFSSGAPSGSANNDNGQPILGGSAGQQVNVPVYQVVNYANRGQVNGPPVGTSLQTTTGQPLAAPLVPQELVAVPDPAAAGKPTSTSMLLVGPSSYLTNLLAYNWRLGWGQYWVVAVMPSNDSSLGYDWAIVSGGAPEYTSPYGCLTTPPAQVPVGPSGASSFLAWMGAAVQNKVDAVDSATQGSTRGLWLMSRKPVDPQSAQEMLQAARDLGYDTSVLVPVQQQGCTYGAPSTPPPPPEPLPPSPTAPLPPPPAVNASKPPVNFVPAQPPQVQVRPRPPNGADNVPVPP